MAILTPETQTNLTLRAITESDINTLFLIIHAAYAEYEGCLDPPSGAHLETTDTLLHKLEIGGGGMVWQGGVAVGSVLYEMRDPSMYLSRLAVPPQFRRQGIGALLVLYVEDAAKARGITEVTLGVRLQLPKNTAFYTRLGYHIASYGSHPGYAEPTYMHMAKTLNHSSLEPEPQISDTLAN